MVAGRLLSNSLRCGYFSGSGMVCRYRYGIASYKFAKGNVVGRGGSLRNGFGSWLWAWVAKGREASVVLIGGGFWGACQPMELS